MDRPNKLTRSNRFILTRVNRRKLVTLNLANCKDGFIAMEATPVKEGRSGIEKDKSAERGELSAQVHAPHFSDAFDTIVFQKYEYLLQEGSGVYLESQVR